MAVELENYVLSVLPNLSAEIKDYVLGVLTENAGDFSSGEDVFEAIGQILMNCHEDLQEESVVELCGVICEMLNKNSQKSAVLLHKTLKEPIKLINAADFNAVNVDPSLNTCSFETFGLDEDESDDEPEDLRTKRKRERRLAKKVNSVPQNLTITVSQAADRKEAILESRGQHNSFNIKVEGIDLGFGSKKLLSNADLTLTSGRRYGLVGRNGVGKTTLLKVLSTGQLAIGSNIRVLHVEQEVNAEETTVLDCVLEADEKRQMLINEERLIQMSLANDSSGSNAANLTRLQQIYEEMQTCEFDKAPGRAASILHGLGFKLADQSRATKEFSGGWRMRIALARALFIKPDLLLLDEPTNMLDMKALLWLENYLQDWASTLLTVSHDRCFLNSVATDVIHMHSQRLDYYSGNYDHFIKSKTEKLLNQQREYEAQRQYREHVQEFIDRFRYNAKRASLVQSKIKMLEKLPVLQPVDVEPIVHLKFPPCEAANPPVLQLDEVSFSYLPGVPILEKVNISVDMDSRICVVGENGSGKTTLLKILLGILEPTSGMRNANRRLKLAYFSQHHCDQLDMDLSPVAFFQVKFPGLKIEDYRAALGRFGISGELALQSISSLSGGQKSRLEFALISMISPNLLVLDEPTNHLDIETVEALGNALKEFQGGVILVSHDQKLIEMVCKELWVVDHHTVRRLEDGFPEYKAIIENEFSSLS